MDNEKIGKIVMTILFAAIGITIVTSMIGPLFSVTYTDEQRENDDAGWIRLAYTKEGKNITYDIGNTITISGDDSQSGSGNSILWADSNITVFVRNGIAQYIGKTTDTVSGTLSNSFSISRNNIRTVINDNGETYTFTSSRYAMVPDADGVYSSFIDGDDSTMKNQKITRYYVGGLMGITAFNDMNTSDYRLYMDIQYEDGKVTGAEWSGSQ